VQIVLKGIPMPPTSNNQYLAIRGRFVPNGSLTRYKRDFEIWARANISIISQAHKELQRDAQLSISCDFYFSKGRVFTTGLKAKSKLQKLDVTNRVKSLHDMICKAIEIDDRQFFQVTLVKHELLESSDEYCDVIITEASTCKTLSTDIILRLD
jgi:Holliday junction resolvase RusA-like endonuclease